MSCAVDEKASNLEQARKTPHNVGRQGNAWRKLPPVFTKFFSLVPGPFFTVILRLVDPHLELRLRTVNPLF